MLYVNPVSPLLNRTTGATPAQSAAQTKEALKEFERLFLYSLLREMHQSVSVAGEKKEREMQLFEEMLDDALAGEMARSGQVGIARQIEHQLNAVGPVGSVGSRGSATAGSAGAGNVAFAVGAAVARERDPTADLIKGLG